jgi:hypothetical protein
LDKTLKKKKNLLCTTEITVDNSVDEFGWGSGDSSVGLWPAFSPALTPVLTS